MIIIKYILLLGFLCATLIGFAQEVKWTSFTDLNDSLKSNPKKVIVKIETDWCGYCKMMDNKVFNHKLTDRKIGDDYYFVKFNAESREEVIFRNNRFKPSFSKGGKHELALALNGKGNPISYPTTILLSSNLEVENRLNGYLKRNHFFLWLKSE